MRGGVSGLVSPHPIASALPALYAEDGFAQRFCAALDEVLAPVFATLDSFPAYLDPWTAPPDLLAWLGEWVGMSVSPVWPAQRRRDLVAAAAALHAWRGTPVAIRAAVRLATGVEPELLESGAVGWSQTPSAGFAEQDWAWDEVVVRVSLGRLQDDELAALTGLLALVMPAHVRWRLDVTDPG